MMSAPLARTSSGRIALTVAAVPTGMKAGVRISPRAIAMTPARAAPSAAQIEKAKRVTRRALTLRRTTRQPELVNDPPLTLNQQMQPTNRTVTAAQHPAGTKPWIIASAADWLRLSLLACALLIGIGPLYQFVGSMIWFHEYLGDYRVFWVSRDFR